MRLSDSQIRALRKLYSSCAGSGQTPYTLKESRITLDSLVRKGLAERGHGTSAFVFPRVGIYYRLTHAGEIVKGQCT